MADRGTKSKVPAFLPIARYGSRYVRKTRLYWVFAIAAWIPTLVWVAAIYAAEESGNLEGVELDALRAMAPPVYRAYVAEHAMIFLQIQGIAVTFVAALTGGGSIAEDARRHAFELYFSRPMSGASYVAGKWAFVFYRLLWVLLFPLLAVFLVAFALLPGLFSACWPVLFPASAAALFMSACYALVVLGVSSTVKSARYAVVFWFILAFFTFVASLILVRITGEAGFESVSFRFAIEHVASWILDAPLQAVPLADPADRSYALSASVLVLWLALAGLFLLRRLRAARSGA
jgi:hypothetical protein